MIITDISKLRMENNNVLPNEMDNIIINLEKNLGVNGVGLAAPQIGINKKIAIVRFDNVSINLINPKIIDSSGGFINKDEGCLSFPGQRFNTLRHREIFVKDDLRPDGFVAVGFEAVVIAHEIDHLEGILIIDRAVGNNKIGRNDPCPCGKKINGKVVKFKKCHGK